MGDFDVIATTVRRGLAVDLVEFAVEDAPPATAYRLGDAPGRPQPVVVAFHDERGDKATLLPELEILASRGFVCLGLDSPITRRAMADRDHLQAFEALLAIGRAATRHIQAEAKILEGSVAVIGRGIGGEVAARVAALSDGIRVAAAIGPLPRRSEFVAASAHPLAVGFRHFHDAATTDRIAAGLSTHDLLPALNAAPETSWLVQIADDDDRIDDTSRQALVLSTPRVIRISPYRTTEDLRTGRARRERLDFITDLC